MTQLTAKPFTARPLTARPFTAYPFGESTSVSNPLVWHAAYPDADGVMQAQLIGSGTPTFNVDDGLLLPDHEGIYRTTAEDTPPWHGARKVTNLLRYSEDFSNAAWTKVKATITEVTDSSVSAPPTGGRVWKMTVTDTGESSVTQQLTGYVSGQSLVHSVWVRAGTSGKTVAVQHYGARVVSNIALTDEWVRATVKQTNSTLGAYFSIITAGQGTADFSVGEHLYVASAQSEDASGQADTTNPSEYVQTTSAAASKYFSYENGNTVSSNVVAEAQGATLDPLPSLYGAPSYTNSLTYSSDLTQWTQTGTSVSALDAVGLTGAPNTATTLTDDDPASVEFVRQFAACPNDSNTATARFFIKKDTDETRFPEVGLDFSGGTLQRERVQLNTKTGALTARASVGTTSYEANSVGDWWEVLVSVANNSTGNTQAIPICHPAITTTPGGTEVAATGSIIVGNVELHLNKTIAAVRGSAPIITAASTVTTTAISMSYDIANHSDTQGAYYCEWLLFQDGDSLGVGPIMLDANGRILYLNASRPLDSMVAYDGTTSVVKSGIAFGGGIWLSLGTSYGNSLMSVTVGGEAGSDAAYDGGWGGSPPDIKILSDNVGSTTPNCPQLIRNIRRYNLSYTAAKAKIEELTS